MGKAFVLIIEDEEEIAQLVSYNLLKAGFQVLCADSGEAGLEYVESEKVDCILLDLMLPGIDGLEVCNIIKSKKLSSHIPIIMLTAKGEEADIITGLESGADDYVTKPFSPKVLIARIKAVLRRENQAAKPPDDSDGKIRIAGLLIDPGRHEVLLDEAPVQLTMTEFGILSLLAGRQGWVFTRQQIIDSVRGYDFLITPRAIDVQIFGLRKKLGKAGQLIETVRGIGYKFVE